MEGGQMTIDDLPGQVQIQLGVVMSGDVPEAVDRPPVDLRMTLLQVVAEVVPGGVTNGLQAPDSSILCGEILHEGALRPRCVAAQAVDAVANEPEVPHLMAHHS